MPCLMAVLLMLFAGTAIAGDKAENACMSCHEDVVKAFAKTRHAVLDGRLAKEGVASCERCHTGAKKHIDSEGEEPIFAFKATDKPITKSNACIDCHKNTNSRHFASSHAKAGMDCTTCHSTHKEKKVMHSSKACISCHDAEFALFKLNEHHRLKEGIMSCTSCHDPHDVSPSQRLGGFKHESCFKCHTDKQGPFLYEHGAVRVEGCKACHDPHGSVNRHMLTYQRVADLCYSCHVTVPGWHSRFTPTTNCTDCHLTIHGSNFSAGFIK